ncbi:hypothetical protein [Arthrobacter sp. MAHUQ-56]
MKSITRKISSSPLLFTYGALALAVFIPLLLFSMTGGSDNSVSVPGLIAVLALSGVRFAWILGSAEPHIYEMIFWLFSFLFMGVAPYVQRRLQFTPGTTPGIRDDLVDIAALAVIVGCLAVILGSWLAAKRPVRHASEALKTSASRANVLAVLSLGFSLYYASKIGFLNFFGSRVAFARARSAVWPEETINAIVVAGSSMSLLVAFLAQMQIRSNRRMEGKRGPTVLPLVLLLALIYTVNPISSPRYVFGTVALGVLAAFGAYASLSRFRIMSASALFGLVAVFPALDSFRYTTTGGVEMEDPLKSMTSGDFDAFAQLVNTFEYVQQHGSTLGQQLLGVIFFWVPRSIWATKPIDTGTMLADFKGYSFGNLSAPIWAEFYINGGWPFMVLGMAVLGYTLRRADRASNAVMSIASVPPLLGCVLPFYLLIILRGSLLAAMAYLSVVLVCALFVSQREAPPQSLERKARVRAHEVTISDR